MKAICIGKYQNNQKSGKKKKKYYTNFADWKEERPYTIKAQ